MATNKSFFTPGPCGDQDYEQVRDLPQARECRRLVEELWQDYAPYSDPNCLSDARNHFHQRFWEMYLCVTMLKRGFVIEQAGGEGPEFSTTIGERKVWFEAIAPLVGSGPDRVLKLEMGKLNWPSPEPVLMRYTAALSEKLRKYQECRAKGIVSERDGYVVAINANKIPNACFVSLLSLLPYYVQAFLPFGTYTVTINPRTSEKVDEHYQYRNEVKKQSGSAVSTQPFLDPAYVGISAVIHSISNVAGYACSTKKWGDDFEVLHNPMAANPLPYDALRWCKYRYVHDGVIETVTR